MLPHEATPDTALWEDGSGVSVDYSLEVVENLRRLAVDGLNAFAHGGREIGGVLYGRRDESRAAVLACVELECEHALGPRFILSEKDHAVMTGLLEPRDGLDAIGWFRAHTRSGLELDAKDRELFDRCFERPLSVGLILKPTQWGPAAATFYTRRASGEVGPESVREFAIEPPRREPTEEIAVIAETMPATVAPASVALVVAEPVAVPAVTAPSRSRDSLSRPRQSWPWAMCAGVLLGAVITLALQSRPARQVHADTPPQTIAAREVQVADTADRAEPDSAASPVAKTAMATQALQAPLRKDAVRPEPRKALIPRIAPVLTAPAASVPSPPPAGIEFAAEPKFPDLALNPPLSINPPLSVAPAAAVTARRVPAYAGPRQGRLIWTGDLAHHGVIEMDGSRVSLGSLSGVLPGVPLALRLMPAEFSRDGLTVFTTDPLRDNKTEPPSKSNGWNGLHFKVDPGRVGSLVLLETPNAENEYKRLVVRNDGRPCSVVLVDWSSN